MGYLPIITMIIGLASLVLLAIDLYQKQKIRKKAMKPCNCGATTTDTSSNGGTTTVDENGNLRPTSGYMV